jgi:hypothetical protein
VGLLRKKALALELGVSIRTISNWMAEGVIPHLKVGTLVFLDPEAVYNALKARDIPASCTTETKAESK